MSQMRDNDHKVSRESNDDDLELLLLQGIPSTPNMPEASQKAVGEIHHDDEEQETFPDHDAQGALGYFAEASQDMATAGLELGLGRHFACADFCNQAAEKAAQAVSLLRTGHRTMYDHDLRSLGEKMGAPQEIQDEMARLTPFHPEKFYADTPPEEADEIISAEQASSYIQSARNVLRWARSIVLTM
jgi:HEPN domain-containing protein